MKKMLALGLLGLLTACGGDEDPFAGVQAEGGDVVAAGSTGQGAMNGATNGTTNGNAARNTAPGTGTEVIDDPAAFLSHVYQRNLGEIALAQLALNQSDTENVRLLAQRLLTHHSFLNHAIAAVLAQTGTALPDGPTSDAIARLQALGDLDGIAFDRTWANYAVQHHETALNQFREQANMAEADVQGGAASATVSASAAGTGGGTSSASASGNGNLTATAADNGNGNTSAAASASGSSSGASSASSAVPGLEGAGLVALAMQSLALHALPALQVHLQAAKTLESSHDPAAFLTNLYRDGLAEIALSQLALEQAQDGEVQAFAQRMIDDHITANQQIAAQAQVLGVTVPQELSAEQQALAAELARMSGANFDKAYMNHNVLAHETAVVQARAQAQTGTDASVRALAASLQPVLQTHLGMADTLYARLVPGPLFAIFSSGAGEILVSQLALQLSDDEQVRQFADRLIMEHDAADDQARDLARQLGRELPSEAAAEAVRAYVSLSQLSGDEFDRAFLERNVQLHELAVQLVEQAHADERNVQAQLFAGAVLPVLREHLEQARQLQQEEQLEE